MKELIETWQISHHMNELLLAGIQEEHLTDLAVMKGRNIGEQFGHIHNVRLLWLQASAPDLMAGTSKIDRGSAISKEILLAAYAQSTPRISELLRLGLETGRIKGFKPHPQAFLGYIISHEAHHRGQIILGLKENGHMPDKKTLFGLWEWGRVGRN